jgi:protein TonB
VAISEQEAIKLYVIGRDVQPPQAIFTPEPTFPDKASTENYQGVVILNMVVDATGRVQNIHVIRAMGMGMEEAAVSVVEKKWRLKPAQRDKKPVAVEMNIEVAFNKF